MSLLVCSLKKKKPVTKITSLPSSLFADRMMINEFLHEEKSLLSIFDSIRSLLRT